MKFYSLMLAVALFVYSQTGFTKPILNRTVVLPSPVFEPIHPDSEDLNLYWVHTTEFNICGLDTANPIFSVRAFKLNEIPRTFISFDLCAKRDSKKIAEYQSLIQQVNSKGKLEFIEAYYMDTPKVEFFMQKEFGIVTSCSRNWITDTTFTCGAFSVGERRAERLYNYFRWTQGLLSTEYLKYRVGGVEQDDAGNLKDIIKEYHAIVYVRGLSDYPQLFNTEWIPQVN